MIDGGRLRVRGQLSTSVSSPPFAPAPAGGAGLWGTGLGAVDAEFAPRRHGQLEALDHVV